MHPFDVTWLSSQMEIGKSTELDINGTRQKVDLVTALELQYPTQVEVLAEGAACYLAQGNSDLLAPGWSWPTHKYRMLANERRILNISSEATGCITVVQRDTGTGTLVVTETRIK